MSVRTYTAYDEHGNSVACGVNVQAVQNQGNIYFAWNGKQVSPFNGLHQQGSDPANPYGVNAHYCGYGKFVTQGGVSCVQFHNVPPPPYPGSPGTPLDPSGNPWKWTATTMGRNPVKFTYPSTRAYTLGLWIPAGGLVIPCGGNSLTMLEQHYVNIGGHGPLTFYVHQDHIECAFLTGAYSNGQFQYNPQNTPNVMVIPPGGFKPGAWNYISWTVDWATDNTGGVAFYYQARGDSVWQAGGSHSGIPTALWNAGSAPPTGGVDLLNNYEWNVTQPFDMFYTGYNEGDLLSDVRALLP